MTYTVVWLPPALQALAAIWVAATDRNAVTRASNNIDRALGTDPQTVGRCLFDTVWEFSAPPLVVEYEIDDGNMIVSILFVWDAATGHPPVTGN